MSLLSRPLALIATLATVATLSMSASPARAGEVDPLTGAPEVGRCYDVPGKVAYEAPSTGAETVGCRTAHTLWVIAVAEVPEEVPLDGKAFKAYLHEVCIPALDRAVGDRGVKWGMAAAGLFNFVPTPQQQEEGARWLSCNLGLYAGGTKLVRTKAAEPPRVDGRLGNALQLCGARDYSRTNCAARHAYRSTKATVVKAATTTRAYQRAADRICPRHVSSNRWMWAAKSLAPSKFVLTCLERDRG